MSLKPVQRAQLRLDAIVEIVGSLEGRLPSSRKMADLLQQYGIQTSHVQVVTDYRRLNLFPRESCLPLLSVKDLTLVEGEREEEEAVLGPVTVQESWSFIRWAKNMTANSFQNWPPKKAMSP